MIKTIVSRISLWIMIISLLTAYGCNRKVFYNEDLSVDADGWNLNDPLYFNIDVTDLEKAYNAYIDLRVNTDYPYANFFLFVTTLFPDGHIANDTMECAIVNAEGEWYGKRTGRFVDFRYPFYERLGFSDTGRYTFVVRQGMRDSNIVGVQDVGIYLEYADI